jgi:hypothetical protein
MSGLEQTVGALPNKFVLWNGCSQVLKLERRTVGSAPVIGLFRHSEENPHARKFNGVQACQTESNA